MNFSEWLPASDNHMQLGPLSEPYFAANSIYSIIYSFVRTFSAHFRVHVDAEQNVNKIRSCNIVVVNVFLTEE